MVKVKIEADWQQNRIYLRGSKREIEEVAEKVGGVCKWVGGWGWPMVPDVVFMLLDSVERYGKEGEWEIDEGVVKWAVGWGREVLKENEKMKVCTPVEKVVGTDGARLWDYQAVDVEVLSKRRRGIAGYKVGLGKTAVAVNVLRRVGVRKVLLVVPKTIIMAGHWTKEFQRWYPGMRVVEMLGGTRQKLGVLDKVLGWEQGGEGVVVCTNYEAFRVEKIVEKVLEGRVG